MHPARTKKENDASPVFRDRERISSPFRWSRRDEKPDNSIVGGAERERAGISW